MPRVANVQPWKPQAAPMAWRNGRVHWWRTGKGVVASSWSSLPDGTDDRPEARSPLYPTTTNQGVSDITADGRYALVTVERSNHWPNADGTPLALPGAGVYNDLWLHELATGRTWKLVDLLTTGGAALIWPRFDPTGGRIVWAEKWNAYSLPLDGWDLHVADLAWAAGVPYLTNKKVRRTNAGFVEPYAFVDGGSAIIAAADEWVGRDWDNLQIVKVPVDPTKPVVRLSPSVWNEGWPFGLGFYANYTEFAYPMPAFPDRLMIGRAYQADNYSIEFWTIPKAGGAAERLTYFSKPGHAQYQGPTCIVGGVAWDPDDPLRFVVGYATTKGNEANDYKAAMVTLAA